MTTMLAKLEPIVNGKSQRWTATYDDLKAEALKLDLASWEPLKLDAYIPGSWYNYKPSSVPKRAAPHLVANDIILDKSCNVVSWLDGNNQVQEAQSVFLTEVRFVERSGYCGGAPRGAMSGTIVEDVVGFLRAGAPMQKARYTAAYGWNVQRASRAIIEGRKVYFD